MAFFDVVFIILLSCLSSFSQEISYQSCSSDTDCIHFMLPSCVGGTCVACTSSSNCLHFSPTSQCQTNTGGASYCEAPCNGVLGPDICSESNGLCLLDHAYGSYRCQSCQTAADCSQQYPSGVQCNLIEGVGYCGYCLADSQCETGQRCIDFRCIGCEQDSDCGEDQPKCEKTLKGNTCKCYSDSNCPSSKPSCITKSTGGSAKCYMRPNLSLVQGGNVNTIFLKFNKAMAPGESLSNIFAVKLGNLNQDMYSISIQSRSSTNYEITISVFNDLPKTPLTVTISRPAKLLDNEGLSIDQLVYTIEVGPYELISLSDLGPRDSIAKTMQGLIIFLLVCGLFSAILRESTVLFWIFVDSMQTIYYLVYFDVQYPLNIEESLRMFSISAVRFLPNFLTLIFPQIRDKNYLARAPQSFDNHGVHSLFLTSIGNLIFIAVILTIVKATVNFILKNLKLPAKVRNYLIRAYSSFAWSETIKIALACYCELAFACFIQIREISFKSANYAFSSLFAILSLLLLIAAPLLLTLLLKKKDLTKYGFGKQKFGQLIEMCSDKKMVSKYYLLIVVVRKFVTCLLMTVLVGHAMYVMLVLISINLLMLLILQSNPLKIQRYNYMLKFYEIISLILNLLVFSLIIDGADDKPNGEIRLWTAWQMITMIFIYFIGSLLFLIVDGLISLNMISLVPLNDSLSKKIAKIVPEQELSEKTRRSELISEETQNNLKRSTFIEPSRNDLESSMSSMPQMREQTLETQTNLKVSPNRNDLLSSRYYMPRMRERTLENQNPESIETSGAGIGMAAGGGNQIYGFENSLEFSPDISMRKRNQRKIRRLNPNDSRLFEPSDLEKSQL